MLRIVVHAQQHSNKEGSAGCGTLRVLAGYGKSLHNESYHVDSPIKCVSTKPTLGSEAAGISSTLPLSPQNLDAIIRLSIFIHDGVEVCPVLCFARSPERLEHRLRHLPVGMVGLKGRVFSITPIIRHHQFQKEDYCDLLQIWHLAQNSFRLNPFAAFGGCLQAVCDDRENRIIHLACTVVESFVIIILGGVFITAKALCLMKADALDALETCRKHRADKSCG
jgi:hypothetical protein